MLPALIFTTLIAEIPRAKAFESPVKDLIEISKEKIKKVKRVNIYNDVDEKETLRPFDKLMVVSIVEPQAQGKENTEPQKRKRSHMEEIEEAVEFASEATGVREDFLMGMLVVESDLGRKTGECTYAQVEEGAEQSYQNGLLSLRAYNTFIERRELIKQIAADIGRDYRDLRVSCNPARYAGTGGAMGVPQFMPDIWLLYKDRISEIVGKDNPDPWVVKDGVVAMALLLSDTPGVKQHEYYAERNAAKMYLSGTTSWQYDWYANQIMYWAKNHKRLMG